MEPPIYGTDLSEDDLQVLGALPFDPARVSPLVLETLSRLKRLGYVEDIAGSSAMRLTAKGEMTKTLVRRSPAL